MNYNWKNLYKFHSLFNKQGKQGIVGLVLEENNDKIVFKMSRYLNHSAIHENMVISGLKDIIPYCPHFLHSYGVSTEKIDSAFRNNGNPFEIINKYPIEHQVLWQEYIEGDKFSTYIRSMNSDTNVIFSVIKQVLLCLIIAQREKQFSHYDLHSDNIILRKIDPNTIFIYSLDENNHFIVPTYGYCPIIIDYGYSYINDMEGNTFWNTLAHTDVGFLSDRFDWNSDPRLFLITMNCELKRKKGKLYTMFNNIVKNLYKNQHVEMISGWDTLNNDSVPNAILDEVDKVTKRSKLFREYGHFCIDNIQTLIILPMQEGDYKNIKKNYSEFINEFIKIEKKIGSMFYNLYIFKRIIDICRDIRPYYINSVDNANKEKEAYAVNKFSSSVKRVISSISNFFIPTDIDYKKMLHSLILLGNDTESMMYELMKKVVKTKDKDYSKSNVKNIEQLFGIINYNIPTEVNLTSDSIINIMDVKNKKTHKFKLTRDEYSHLKKLHPHELCIELYKKNM